jgi:Ca-activated chloride channel family protein
MMNNRNWSLFAPQTLRCTSLFFSRSEKRPSLVHSFYVNLRRCVVVTGILCLASNASPVRAQSDSTPQNTPALINAANQLLRDGEIQAALDAYSTIKSAPSSQSQLDFNHGVALYRNGDIAAAQELFAATAGSTDDQLASSASYNLGNCLYTQSLQQIQQPESKADPAQIIEQLRTAISHYRNSLRSSGSGSDARANIELAAELIRQLEEQQEKKDEQQQQDQQQDQNEQDKNQQDENQKEQDQSQSQSENESEQQQNDSQSKQDQQQQQQSSENQQQDQQQGDSQQQSENQQQQNELQQAESDPSDQSKATDPSDSSDADEESQDQQPTNPEGELKPADQNQTPQGKPNPAGIDEDDAKRPMTREEAMKMLQAIRDRDMIRRFQQQQRDRSRQVPVEKDW